MSEFIQTTQHGQVAYITLNRPQALNALNLDMVLAIQNALNQWATDPNIVGVVLHSNSPKGLCAGGDIRFFHQAALANDPAIDTFFTAEYALNHCIANYPKPYIAFMQGVVMGGGMGISTIANPNTGLRVVSDTSKLAMPEIKIGLFPDVGGTHFLSHCPAELGTYLALTATPIDASSALFAGLADVYCPADTVTTLLQQLQTQHFETGAQLLSTIRSYCIAPPTPPTRSTLAQHATAIAQAFSNTSVSQICAALTAMNTAFSTAALQNMAAGSPLLVHATLHALQTAKTMSLGQALRMERSLMKRCFAQGEPIEGIRALAVDKDHQPKWQHQQLSDVTQAQVLALFEPVWTDEAHPLRHLAP